MARITIRDATAPILPLAANIVSCGDLILCAAFRSYHVWNMDAEASNPCSSVKKRVDNSYCCVPQCRSKGSTDVDISFHKFPRENEKITLANSFGDKYICSRRLEWVRVLKIGKPVSNRMVVCSKHFKKTDYHLPGAPTKRPCLKRTAVPSEFLPTVNQQGSCRKQLAALNRRTIRQSAREAERTARATAAESLLSLSDINVESLSIDQEDHSTTAAEGLLLLCDVSSVQDEPVDKSSPTRQTVAFAEKCVQVQTDHFQSTFEYYIMHLPESQLKVVTGLHSFKLLDVLADLVGSVQPAGSKFSPRVRIIMTAMKMKTNVTFSFLSVMFRCVRMSCKTVFKSTVVALASVLQSAIVWPDKEEILGNMPKCFKAFKKTRVVLDCTEIPIMKPRCLKCRIKTYSQYKGRHTFKYMIGVTPGGLISFVSLGYGGRASDKAIFEQSNVLTQLNSYEDDVMVDKGFLIQSVCDDHRIGLIRPPFLRKQSQFSAADATFTRDVAKARVHVERVIQRVKIFKVLTETVSWNMLPYVDCLMVVAAGIANLSSPILSDCRF